MSIHHRFTIGQIDYANSWPLFYGLDKRLDQIESSITSAVPSELNRMLGSGLIDVSGISSFSYAQYAEDYILLPGLSVGSVGRVNSILLFLKEPLEQKLPATISLSSTSATSVNLLKIMMELRFHCKPAYETSSGSLESMLESADGALLIGDPAIAAAWSNKSLYVIDLGAAWHEWTGYGMTYAVVAARKSAFASCPQLLHELHRALLANRIHNCNHINPIIDKACTQLGGQYSYWDDYFKCLNYEFGQQLQDGLSLYYRYAKQIGLLQKDVTLSFLEGKQA